MIFLYDCGLFIYALLIDLAARFGNEKARLWRDGRKDIFQRMATELSKNQDKTRKTIWFHVSSLGEFEQGRPIIEALKSDSSIAQSPNIILTFFSPSGYEIRKNYPFADHIFYLPMDTSRNAQRFLDIIQPGAAVFIKYEFWFHYLTQLQKRKVPLLLVSAIFRDKQFAVYNPYAPLLTRILKNFTKIFLQDTPSVNLLKKHDFSNIVLSGDTRVDRVAAIAEEGKTLPIVAEFVGNAPVFVGGSTWEADEKQILPIFSNPNFKDWRFIFAPHDISLSNINRLEKLLPEKSVRYSEIVKNTEGAILHDFFYENKNRILIIDNIGMLSTLYRYGKIAYIGGGFGSGIHNTLEPIAHGLPVLFGPKYEKFTEAVRLIETGGGFVVNKEKGVDNQHFEAIMESLLVKENYEKARDAARDYIHQNRGATEQVIEEINKIMGK
jgi:3-deoxy-D-manno-octulosonic-acid transferase